MKIETIEGCYQNADPEMIRELIQFRTENVPKTFDYKGNAFEYLVIGSKDPTLLIFHSAFGSADDIFQEVHRIKGKYRIITPTIRNLGSLDEICSTVNEMLSGLSKQVPRYFLFF